MPRLNLALKALIAGAVIALAVVIWLAERVRHRDPPEARPLVLEELVRGPKVEEAHASSWDSPAARFERLLIGNTVPSDLSPPGSLPDLRKQFLRHIAQAVLAAECYPKSHWNSAVAFSNGIPFAIPFAHADGYQRLARLLKGALRVLGQDGLRAFGPVLFARQLNFSVEDVVYGPIADLAADALEAASYPDRLRFPQRAIELGAPRWHAALRVWWLQNAKSNGWNEELSVVQRMMEERGIQPDGTGALLRQRE